MNRSTDFPDRGLLPGTAARVLRALLRDDPFVMAPGVHDLFSLRAIEQAGFKSAAISGAVLSHALLGMPDLGLLSLTECVDHCRRLTRVARIPITADADAGFGNGLGVQHAVRAFEEAGAAGINIEDQVVPRRWGSSPGKEVVSLEEMVAKIRAAVLARRDPDFVLIVRTDAFACESVDQVVRRALAYEQAGADLLMPIGPGGEENIARLVGALRIPVTINVGTGLAPAASAGNVSLKRLRTLGVRRVSFPQLLPAVAAGAMTNSLAALSAYRDSADSPDYPAAPVPVADLKALMHDAAGIAQEAALLAP